MSALDGESKPKSEICRSLGGQALVDDDPRYALNVPRLELGFSFFYYENSYPWCKMDSIDDHPLVMKVRKK
ncbi:hypothetical protein MLD38_015110 [Melastoma candidum]|uniref:Uncharacterized protein n=1 Tax=Melastoma candidum TaxID=119954 RepID=A0ACB9RI44_9MYRT|nr:hypothetical protein MLD38_015110 [Melastoma candidum]